MTEKGIHHGDTEARRKQNQDSPGVRARLAGPCHSERSEESLSHRAVTSWNRAATNRDASLRSA
jgi:hypothetical protein